MSRSRYIPGFGHKGDDTQSEPEWKVQQRQADALECIADLLKDLVGFMERPRTMFRDDVPSKVYEAAEAITKACEANMPGGGGGTE